MGFFGFLKKSSQEKIEAPKTPTSETALPVPPADGPQLPPPTSTPPTGASPSMSALSSTSTPPMGNSPSMSASQPTDVLDEFPPPPGDNFSEADFMSPSSGLGQGASDAIPSLPEESSSLPNEMPPLEADSSPTLTGSVEPQPDVSSLPENVPELPDLPPAPAAPMPGERGVATASPSSAEDVSSMPSEHETDLGLESVPSDNLPDFTDDDIAAAEVLMKPEPATPQEPLPSFKDAEELRTPQLEVRGVLYVPATRYREALDTLKQFRASVHKGETQLKKLTTSVTTHKEKFQQYAQSLNGIQESLITMDNMLMQAR